VPPALNPRFEISISANTIFLSANGVSHEFVPINKYINNDDEPNKRR